MGRLYTVEFEGGVTLGNDFDLGGLLGLTILGTETVSALGCWTGY